MPTRSRTATERAEARRRSRAVARGEEVASDAASPAPTPSAARPPSILARLFPPAPPLAGKGDPLAGFTYRGRFRGLVAGAWLLLRNPLPWGVAAAGWAVLQLALLVTPRQNLVAFAITLGQYGLLIGAGWFGWQRPWLFGTAAGVLGVVLHAVIAGIVTIQAGEGAEALAVVGSLTTLVILYGLVGAFAGFYGGYLRRRMAAQSPTSAKGRRR